MENTSVGEATSPSESMHKEIRGFEDALLEFQRAQAEQVTRIIKEYAKTIPKGDPEAMRQAAANINEVLDRLHLAIRDISGQPALLAFDGGGKDGPRFRIRLSHQGARLTSSSARLDAFDLVLIPDTSKSHTPRLRHVTTGR